MKKINELEIKRTELVREMDVLQREASMTEDQVKTWDAKKEEVTNLGKEIERAKEQEELNKMLASETIRNEDDGEKKDIVRSFYAASKEYINSSGRSISRDFMGEGGGLLIPKELFRADPILTTTNTSLVPMNVTGGLSMVTGDNFSLLQALGVQFYPGLTGTTELPYMAQLSTSKPGEGGDASTADASPLNVELKPQTYSVDQTWSKMALLNMPGSIYQGIIADMQIANERQVVTDLFGALCATDVSVAASESALTYGDMINLTNIDYNIGNAAFVADNDIRVYLEQTPVNSAGIALAWNALNNTVGGRRAISSDAMQDKRAVYGNFGFAAVGEWGSPELVINGLTTPGQLKVTVLGFYKPVVRNKYAFKHFSADASCAV
jgi:hypothetical protein